MKADTKVFLGIILAAIFIVFGAVLWFSRPTSSSKTDSSVLIRPNSNSIVSSSASATLVEFGDFQCPACGAYHPVVKLVLSEFQSSLTFVFRNFPLTNVHKNAYLAAQAAEAAGAQGKYWQMFDKIFETQRDWSDSDKAKDMFVSYAQGLGLDAQQFKKDIDDATVRKKIDQDIDDGSFLRVDSTPTFYLNGTKIENPSTPDDFRALIAAAIQKAPKPSITSIQAYHIHANFKVYINGVPFDFSSAKYQSNKGKDLNEDIHLHDGKGDLIHIHKKGVVLSEFFQSLGMALSKNCFTDDSKRLYCSDGTKSLKMFVNSRPNTLFEAYEPRDLDRILITYGADTRVVVNQQMTSVPDDACIYSEKCPQRGKPPTEECVGGLGTGCKD